MFLSISKISIIISKTQAHGRLAVAIAFYQYQPLASRVLWAELLREARSRFGRKGSPSHAATERSERRRSQLPCMQQMSLMLR